MIQFRQAVADDIPGIQVVRHAVRENRLSNPALVTDADCLEYITERGRGWVAVLNGTIIGFSIADLHDHNVWALFVSPEYEACGVGSMLHGLMLDWYFGETDHEIWLSTAPNTRAEQFYLLKGWTDAGFAGNERKFILTQAIWTTQRFAQNSPGR